MVSKTVFLDTAFFLHYRPLEEIDWLATLEADHVTLLLPAVVIRQLNRIKDTPGARKARDRAGSALKRLEELAERERPIVIRDNVQFCFRTNDPTVEFSENQLSRDVEDDWLIATIIENRLESADVSVVLVTDDLGLKLKARTKNIPVLKLPHDLRLPDEIDPGQQRIKELEDKLRQLQERFPALRLAFKDWKDHFQVTLTAPPSVTHVMVSQMVHELRQKYPPLDFRDIEEKPVWNPVFGQRPSRAAVADYNEKLSKFYDEYERYLWGLRTFSDSESRTITLEILLVNEGGCPAEDVDIILYFPDGLEVFERSNRPTAPSEPKPPSLPKTDMEKAMDRIRDLTHSNVFSYPTQIQGTVFSPPRNVSRPLIKRMNNFEVSINVGELKHGCGAALDPLYVQFPTRQEATSFGIDYSLLAGNFPHRIEGKLHVIVQAE